MSHSKICYNKNLSGTSPLLTEYKRVVKTDKDGTEHVVFEAFDPAEIRKSNGSSADWKLNVLLNAGINPNFPIRTGLNTRLEGVDVISEASAVADSLFAEESTDSK